MIFSLFFFSRTVTNMFIMNLAAADLLVLVFCLPATVVQDVTKTWFFGLILCKFVNYIQVVFFLIDYILRRKKSLKIDLI